MMWFIFYTLLALLIWHSIGWVLDIRREKKWRENADKFVDGIINKDDGDKK